MTEAEIRNYLAAFNRLKDVQPDDCPVCGHANHSVMITSGQLDLLRAGYDPEIVLSDKPEYIRRLLTDGVCIVCAATEATKAH